VLDEAVVSGADTSPKDQLYKHVFLSPRAFSQDKGTAEEAFDPEGVCDNNNGEPCYTWCWSRRR
jgi:hypothetical protein